MDPPAADREGEARPDVLAEGPMRRVAFVVLAVGFAAALVLATLRESVVQCELCVRFGGAEACRKASAADRDQALAMARNTACAVLAGGVTRGMQCMRVVPHAVRCQGE
jgi:hypothetical protein